MLAEIEAVLADAEEKQIYERGIQIWLEDLEDLAYDLDDVLDEIATEALRRKLMHQEPPASTSKVRAFIPTCCTSLSPSTLLSDFRMKSKLDEITLRLQDLFERRRGLGLRKVASVASARGSQRTETTSLIHEPCVHGRDEDKKAIMDLLLNDPLSNTKFGVVPIVGMGGVGKTTLAQMVYNDETVEKHFDVKAWNWIQVQVQLKKSLAGKKFLIVLDDVWSKNHSDWSKLKSPFIDGAQGSKVIVTTRDRDVGGVMGTVKYHDLKPLSDDDCWFVFSQHAFENLSMDGCPNLASIGRKIVAKCGGLPLAARTLGGLLRCKSRNDEWEDVLNSKLWELSNEESDILPALRISYYHLPSHLKKCFAYCSLLPNDYEFEKEELVLLWMAEGFIQQPKGEKQMEDLGYEYFRELLVRSFFQPSSSGERSLFVMHDLINALAQELGTLIHLRGTLCISGLENVVDIADAIEANLNDKHGIDVLSMKWSNSSDDSQKESVELEVLEILQPNKNLKKLTISSYHGLRFPTWVGDSQFSNMVRLKLEDCEKCAFLPPLGLLPSLAELHILRFENMPEWKEWSPLGVDAEAQVFARLSELYIQSCPKLLGKLPSNLPSLKTLKIMDCPQLVIEWLPSPTMPHGMRNTLPFDSLHLVISLRCFNSIMMSDYSTGSLPSCRLEIENCPQLIFLFEEEKEGQQQQYEGLPNIMNLEHLEIFSCAKLQKLPRGLPSTLRTLFIDRCTSLQSLPELVMLNNLEKLEVFCCPALTGLCPGAGLPPTLKELVIYRCEKLEAVLAEGMTINCPSLESIDIRVCDNLKTLPDVIQNHDLRNLNWLFIEDCDNLESLPEGWFPKTNLRKLHITGCKKLDALPQSSYNKNKQPHFSSTAGHSGWNRLLRSQGKYGLLLPTSLIRLEMLRFPNLELSSKVLQTLTSLEQFYIVDCPMVTSIAELGLLPSLSVLWITNCPNLASFPEQGLPLSLLQLCIHGCPILKHRCEKEKGQYWPFIAHIPSRPDTWQIHLLAINQYASVPATFLASRFAGNALRGVHRNRSLGNARDLVKLQKPPEPDFTAEAD
ncbi:NB-ARC domain-containing disease resistance protein [Actinidia rufa]|uniref:NB-ARC domain-containing disease resistance protein n=1 Tax=Actinidia rufa TaxID=165716 RepID=A0A7J0FV12_9ERIC|nr:NB-ARC domain-containing disease resistance protein [Actinidia rufa]